MFDKLTVGKCLRSLTRLNLGHQFLSENRDEAAAWRLMMKKGLKTFDEINHVSFLGLTRGSMSVRNNFSRYHHDN